MSALAAIRRLWSLATAFLLIQPVDEVKMGERRLAGGFLMAGWFPAAIPGDQHILKGQFPIAKDGQTMPTYVYEVIEEDGSAGEQFEVVQGIKEPALTHHPENGKPVQRVIQPVFISGRWSESSMQKTVSDDKKLDQMGFTKYVKAGDGVYEKRAGKGPQLLSGDSPIQPSDLK